MSSDPPRLTEALLRAVLPAGVVAETVLGDLREELGERAAAGGSAGARTWYRRQAVGLVLHALSSRLIRGEAWHRRAHSHSLPRPKRREAFMSHWMTDLAYAGRSLLRAPAYAAVVVLTLALAIGANAAIFSVVDAVLIDPLPFRDADKLVILRASAPGIEAPPEFGLSVEFYLQFQDHADVFESLTLVQGSGGTLRIGDEAERARIGHVNASFWKTMGVAPIIGREPSAEEVANRSAVVVSYGLWQSRFGGDPAVLGRTVEVNTRSFPIIGVMPPGFGFPEEATSIWLAFEIDPTRVRPGNFTQRLIGRVKPGVEIAGLQDQLAPLVARLPEIYPDNPRYVRIFEEGRLHVVARPLEEDLVRGVRQSLWILFGSVAVLLLIACANVVNLSFVRAASRQHDLAIRQSLGARRIQVMRLHLAETLLLALAGGALGSVVAATSLPLLIAAAPAGVRRLDEVGFDGGVLLFVLTVSVVAAFLIGLAPAARYSRASTLRRLRGTQRLGGLQGGPAARRILVVAQSSLAIVLLIAAGLLLRSFSRVLHTDPGYDYHDVFTFQVAPPWDTYPGPFENARFHAAFTETLTALPGVESVGAIHELFIDEGIGGRTITVEEDDGERASEADFIGVTQVTPGFFETLRIPVLEGRPFLRSDWELDWSAGHVIVSRSLAERYWPGESALGKRLRVASEEEGWDTVIGVVSDVRDRDLREPPRRMLYRPPIDRFGADGETVNSPGYVVRARNAEALAEVVRQKILELDEVMPYYAVQTMEEVVATSVARLRFTMITLVVAAALATLVGAVGLYGVLSYLVSLRRHEIGLRMALGARGAQVLAMVIRQGSLLAGLGIVIGLGVGALTTRLLQGLLFETPRLDPFTFVVVAAATIAIAAVASYLPARRAASVSPLESMIGE